MADGHKTWSASFVEWPGFRPQLFNLESDPGEYEDLGEDRSRAGVRREMKERLLDWMASRKTRARMSDADVELRTDTHRARGIHIGIW